jgi:hypothetical protein
MHGLSLAEAMRARHAFAFAVLKVDLFEFLWRPTQVAGAVHVTQHLGSVPASLRSHFLFECVSSGFGLLRTV